MSWRRTSAKARQWAWRCACGGGNNGGSTGGSNGGGSNGNQTLGVRTTNLIMDLKRLRWRGEPELSVRLRLRCIVLDIIIKNITILS